MQHTILPLRSTCTLPLTVHGALEGLECIAGQSAPVQSTVPVTNIWRKSCNASRCVYLLDPQDAFIAAMMVLNNTEW